MSPHAAPRRGAVPAANRAPELGPSLCSSLPGAGLGPVCALQRRSRKRRTCCVERPRAAGACGAGRSPGSSSALSSPSGCSTPGAARGASSHRYGRGKGGGPGDGAEASGRALIRCPADRPARCLRLRCAALQPHRAALREIPSAAPGARDVRPSVHLLQVRVRFPSALPNPEPPSHACAFLQQ